MLVGSEQSFSATDDQGRLRNDVTWSVSDATIASLADDGSGTLTGVAPGQITLTATLGGISGQAAVNVLSGTSFPLGTTLWSAPAISGYSAYQVVQATPVAGGPDLYSFEYSVQNLLVRALTAGGQELWRSPLGPNCGARGTPDRNGGLIVAFRQATGTNCGNITVVDLDSQTGSSVWSYTSSMSDISWFEVAIGFDGKVWLNDVINATHTLVAVDGDTGVLAFLYAAPAGSLTYIDINGRITISPSAGVLGRPSVGPDGTVFAEVMVRNDVQRYSGPYSPSVTLSLLAVPPGGSAAVTPFNTITALQPDGSAPFPWIGDVIPDGQGGTLAAWADCCWQGYHTHVAHGAQDFAIPLNTYAPGMVLGENQTVFATDGGNVVSFDLSGALRWSWSDPDVYGQGVTLIAATSGGGLVAKNTDQNGADTVLRFDANGTPTADQWTAAACQAVDFAAGDAFVGLLAASGQTSMIASGIPADWALYSPWARSQADRRADPKVKVMLHVYQVDDSVYPANQIASEVNAARDYWWKKALIQLDWDSTSRSLAGCNHTLHPFGCTVYEDLKVISSQSQYAEIHDTIDVSTGVTLIFTGLLYQCPGCGMPDDVLGITPFDFRHSGRYEPVSMISGLAPWETVAHELGHTFQLPHYTTTDALRSLNPSDYWFGWTYRLAARLMAWNNVMCGPSPSAAQPTTYCPNTPNTDLDPSQVEGAIAGANKRKE